MTPEILAQRNARLERTRARAEQFNYTGWHFLMLGPPTTFAETNVGAIGHLRRLVDKPDVFDLAAVLEDKTYYGVIARWAEMGTHELSIYSPPEQDPNVALGLGFWMLTLLKIVSKAQFLVPVVADRSWTVIAAAPQGSVRATLLESNFQARIRGQHVEVSQEHVRSLEESIQPFFELKANPRFEYAAEVLGTHHVASHPRQEAALLWSGIEALVEAKQEITFQVSAFISCLLKERGPERKAEFTRIKVLYNTRSRVVHGDPVEPQTLNGHVVDAYNLLADLLAALLERRQMPTRDDLSTILLEE